MQEVSIHVLAALQGAFIHVLRDLQRAAIDVLRLLTRASIHVRAAVKGASIHVLGVLQGAEIHVLRLPARGLNTCTGWLLEPNPASQRLLGWILAPWRHMARWSTGTLKINIFNKLSSSLLSRGDGGIGRKALK